MTDVRLPRGVLGSAWLWARRLGVLAATAGVAGVVGISLGLLVGWGIGEVGSLMVIPNYQVHGPDGAFAALLATFFG